MLLPLLLSRSRRGCGSVLEDVLLEEDEGWKSLLAQALLQAGTGIFPGFATGPGMLRSHTSGRRKQFLAGKSAHMHGIFSSKICDGFEDIK